MNLVLAIDAIRPPLAGIGRYAWELATRLPAHPELESLRFLSDGMWRQLPKAEHLSPAKHHPSEDLKLNYRGGLRQKLGRLPIVSRSYARLAPMLASFHLRSVKNSIFHGTNYYIPASDLPSLVTIHDLSTYRYPEWHPKTRVARMQSVIPQAVQRASLILTDSQATRLEVMQEFNLSAEQVKFVHLGVGQEFHPRTEAELLPALARFGLQPGGYSFFVSTIEPRKNLLNLIAAYADLPESLRKRWPLVLVGGAGWESQAIRAEIERASQQGWLKYLGYVDQEMLPLLYAGCRLFTYPSWYEGFGLPIAEAMASGVPVLTSNCSSMPEVAAGAGMLVEPGDPAAIRAGLQQALEDQQWRTQAIHRGLQRAAQLTWDACVENTLTAYRMVQNARK